MRFFAAALAVLALAACQDPAGVGLGLIDEEQLDPNVRSIALDGLATFNDSTVAIGIADPSNQTLAQPRVLAGSVADPVFGDARAVAYVDFLQNSDVEAADPADVTEVWLELRRSYAYGDTTTALPLELRQIQGADTWEADRDYPPDTLLAVGDVLSTTAVVAADSLRRFDLPAEWVSANAATLISGTFGDDFEGFALQVPADYQAAPGVVFGFDTYLSQGSGLRLVVAGDTVVFSLSEVFSSVTTAPPGASEVLPSRATSRAGVTFTASLADVGTTALARARLRLPILAGLAEEGAFVRPIAPVSFLFGVRGEGDARVRDFLGTVLYEEGADELTVNETNALTAAVQAALLDPAAAGYDRYEVVVNPATASLDILPVLVPDSPDTVQPRLTLTLVGGGQ
ncbi:hypothetical protein [Rubrivirga sp. IMCC45206]|uniref:hypothetical protein n=1 Tax=Rubrivirga sp. IMCC45206 TaxID=3391614 RepID=UPI0039901E7D